MKISPKRHIYQGFAAHLVLSIIFIFPYLAVGQLLSSGVWEAIGPEGGNVKSVLQDANSPDILYAFTYNYPCQIYKSVNSGENWVFLADIDAYLSSCDIDPDNSNCLYASYYNSLVQQ